MSYVRHASQAWFGTLVDPCILSGLRRTRGGGTESIKCVLYRTRLSRRRMFGSSPTPLPSSPISKLGQRHTGRLRLRKRDNSLTGEGNVSESLFKLVSYLIEANKNSIFAYHSKKPAHTGSTYLFFWPSIFSWEFPFNDRNLQAVQMDSEREKISDLEVQYRTAKCSRKLRGVCWEPEIWLWMIYRLDRMVNLSLIFISYVFLFHFLYDIRSNILRYKYHIQEHICWMPHVQRQNHPDSSLIKKKIKGNSEWSSCKVIFAYFLMYG